MKNVRIIIVAVICVALAVGYYYYLSTKNTPSEQDTVELTEVQTVITKDLEKSYPETPRAVVNFYNRILCCYFNEEYSEEELSQLAEQARGLLDEELLQNNPQDQFLSALESEIADYESEGKTIVTASVCDSDDVDYQTVNGDECAYVTANYFLKGSENSERTSQEYCLRKDEDGQWKILGFYTLEGNEQSGNVEE